MSYLSERISYIHGLAEGMDIENETKEGRFLMALVSIMGEMVETIDEIEESNDELLDYIQMLEEKIALFDEDDEDDEYADVDAEDAYTDLSERFLAFECPECGEVVYFDNSMMDSDTELICPECNTPITDMGDPDDDIPVE